MKIYEYTVDGKYDAAPLENTKFLPKNAVILDIHDTAEEFENSPHFQAYRTELNNGLNDSEILWQEERDRLLNSAIVLYQGNFIDMSNTSQTYLTRIRESMGRREKSVNWKVQDSQTGEKKRVSLSRSDINKISDAVIDACQTIHETADTGLPVNPWPLEVT